MNKESPLVATRAALYLRVSTARQAEHDVSIPDQRGRAKPGARRAGISLSKPSWSRAIPPPTIAGPSSSA
jgi:hypothetical protein